MINIAFFGSSLYSTIIFKSLQNIPDFNVKLIVSKEDKPFGREKTITPNEFAKYIRSQNLPLVQPAEFDQKFINFFKEQNIDIGIVVAYGPPYFTQEMIDIPKYKVINIHPSPLPKYRGATPGQWQIINGEKDSSVSIFQIDALPDHGPIITQLPIKIDINDTSESFYHKSFVLAANNIEGIIKNYISNPENIIPQDHSQRSYYPKLDKNNVQINWAKSDVEIHNFIRGLYPWPNTWTYITNKQNQKIKMKVISSNLVNEKLKLKKVQIEGKNITEWSEISSHYSIDTSPLL